jgi:hypothetical protein
MFTHPHIAMADGVEPRFQGIRWPSQLDKKLKNLVGDLPQLEHMLLNARQL